MFCVRTWGCCLIQHGHVFINNIRMFYNNKFIRLYTIVFSSNSSSIWSIRNLFLQSTKQLTAHFRTEQKDRIDEMQKMT